MPVEALLVIDIQIDNVKPSSPYPFSKEDVTRLLENTNRLIAHWQQQGNSVFLIRHNFDGFFGKLLSKLFLGGITIKGEPGVALDPRLKSDYGTVIDKTTQDSFHKTDLAAHMQDLNLSKLYICGLDGAYCIDATAKGALNAGYKPILITDAIITNKPKKAASLTHKLKQKGAMECLMNDIC